MEGSSFITFNPSFLSLLFIHSLTHSLTKNENRTSQDLDFFKFSAKTVLSPSRVLTELGQKKRLFFEKNKKFPSALFFSAFFLVLFGSFRQLFSTLIYVFTVSSECVQYITV